MPKPIQSIIMSGGQGDVIMAALGLTALRSLVPEAIAPEARVYTRSLAADVTQTLLPNLDVRGMQGMGRPQRPRYFTSADTSWSTVIRNWFYPDYYVNFAEHRRRASFGQPRPSIGRRVQTWLNSLKLGPTTDWRHASPLYYGVKMWAPLATAHGMDTSALYRACLETLPQAQALVKDWVDRRNDAVAPSDIAVFPGAGAFQYLPVSLVDDLRSKLEPDVRLRCYFAPGDPLIQRYLEAGYQTLTTPSVPELLPVLRRSTVVITPDSFVSHLAQLAAPGHIAAMSHDFPAHTLHPAASSVICHQPLPCCPCHYFTRPNAESTCASGYAYCNVYDQPLFRRQLVQAVEEMLVKS